MSHILIEHLSVDFTIYGVNSQSLKKRLLSQVTGGYVGTSNNDSVFVRALDNVSLDINDGDRIGLIGHNGAGKSTLLRTIAGIYKPTAGKLTIEGRMATLIDPRVGMDLEATGIENIYLRGYSLGFDKKTIQSKLNDIAKLANLGDFLQFPLKTYSQGMCSRLAFAISTAVSPEILLIDENIGTGDKTFQIMAQKRLSDLYSSVNILIIASHSAELIDQYCNKKLYFKQGKVSEIPFD